MAEYDVLIIGGGPNGLTLGAYLAKAGAKVFLVERRTEVGGGLATEMITLPGFYHNIHAIYHMMVDYAPAYTDLKLEEEYNCRYIYPPLQWTMLLKDGRALCMYNDVEKTCASIEKFSKKDADSYREAAAQYKRFMDGFLAPATFVPSVPALEQLVLFQMSELGQEVHEISSKTPLEIVNETFENEHVRALMLYLACHWSLEPESDGVGYMVPLYINRSSNYRLCVGGSHCLSQALYKTILDNGGTVYTSRIIKRIIVEDGTAKGVELSDGTVIEARAVASTIDPSQTFLDLVGRPGISEDFEKRIEGWKWEKWSLFLAHLALEKAPQFTAASADPAINESFVYLMGYDTTEDVIKHYRAMERGELLEDAGFECCFPSVHDPTQAPPGRHTGYISMMAPYNLKQGAEAWYNRKLKEELAQQCLQTLAKYAPNMAGENVLWQYLVTPVDIENKFMDMVQGSIKQGEYHALQMGFQRPNDEASQARTPVKNLYFCGAGAYPGGLVLLGGGYIAADIIAEDLGIKKWWPEPEMVTRARANNLLP